MGPLHADVSDEFADFVRARQHQLLQAAHLVVGDEGEAEQLLREAFGVLCSRWHTLGDEDPDAVVRRVLYRAATSRWRGRRTTSGRDEVAGGEPRRILEPALARLAPRQRAVIVLRHFEQRSEHDTGEALGISRSAVATHDAAARQRLHQLVPELLGDAAGGARPIELVAQLARAVEHVRERDVVDAARRQAATERQRRRRLGVAALTLVAGLAAFTVVPRGPGAADDRPDAAPTSRSPSAGVQWDAGGVDVLGAAAQAGPTARQLAELPRIPDVTRNQLGLPEVLAFGPDSRIPDLSALGGSGAPVRAVLLRHTGDGFRAVLVRPTLADPYVVVDRLRLVPTIDEAGRTAEPLSVKAIADDRRHVVFVQPNRVHVLDAYTTQVRSFEVPDLHLQEGGWVGREVIAWSDTYRWRISPDTGQVTRLGQAAHPGPHQVTVAGADGLRIQGFDDRGTGSASRTGPPLLSGTWGSTFTNARDRLATGGFLSQTAALELNRRVPMRLFQGVLTIRAESLTGARLLVAPESEGVSVGCCEVLGWAFTDEVLIRWKGTDLLMWNATTGTLLRVSTLPGRQREPAIVGSAATSVAIAP